MAYEDLFKDPYWRAFKRKYEIAHGGKLDLNTGKIIPNTPKKSNIIPDNSTAESIIPNKQDTINYEQVLKRRPVRQPRQIDLSRIITGGQAPTVANIPSTSGNTIGGYGSTYVPNQSTFNKPITGYGTTNKAIPGMTTVTTPSNTSLFSKLKGAGRFVGPALGLGEVFLGKTIPSKVLGGIGAGLSFVPNPIAKGLGTAALIGAGAVDTYSNPQSQIDKSNKDFAKYESMFGTPYNPNLSNLAPGLKPLSDSEIAMLQFKANEASQPQVDTPQAVAPTPEQYQETANQVVADSVDAQNQLTEIANSLQPQPIKYNSAVYGENIYNPSPGLSAMTENRIDQMNNAIQNASNLFNNLYGQGNVDVGSKALEQYIQMVGQQQQEKQRLAEQTLAGYQEAAKQDRYQDIMNGIGNALQNYNYNRSLVFLPSGFNPNGGQTFTPYHLTNAPQQAEAPSNVDRYMQELKLRQALAPDNSAQNQAMERALQSQAFAEATGYNPWIFMGNENLSKEMMSQVIGQQVKNASETRAVLAKLEPELYKTLAEKGGEAYANSIIERIKGEFELAGKNIEQSALTDRANAEQQNKFFMEYMGKMVDLFKDEMNNKAALEKLKLSGMNDQQLAQLKADLESSDPVKQVNATAQLMNAYTRFITPQEAEAYQSKIFPQGLPQFTRRSP